MSHTLMLTQGAVVLSDEGARLLAEGCRPLQGPDRRHMTPAQCTVVNVDILARFWLVRCEPRCHLDSARLDLRLHPLLERE